MQLLVVGLSAVVANDICLSSLRRLWARIGMESDRARNPEESTRGRATFTDALLRLWLGDFWTRWRLVGSKSLTWGPPEFSPPHRVYPASRLVILLLKRSFAWPSLPITRFSASALLGRVGSESFYEPLQALHGRLLQAALAHSVADQHRSQYRLSCFDRSGEAYACKNVCSYRRLPASALRPPESPPLRGLGTTTLLGWRKLCAEAQRSTWGRLSGGVRNTSRILRPTAFCADTSVDGPGLTQRQTVHKRPRPLVHGGTIPGMTELTFMKRHNPASYTHSYTYTDHLSTMRACRSSRLVQAFQTILSACMNGVGRNDGHHGDRYGSIPMKKFAMSPERGHLTRARHAGEQPPRLVGPGPSGVGLKDHLAATGICTTSGGEMIADNSFTGYGLLRRRCSASPATSSLAPYPFSSRQLLASFQGTMA